MNVNSISSTPAFRGLIVCKEVDGNKSGIAINTKNISEIVDNSDWQGPRTNIKYISLGSVRVSHNFEDVLRAYNLAAQNDANVVRVDADHNKYKDIME